MGDTSAIRSIEDITKAITRLPRYLKDIRMRNQTFNLTTFQISL